jgi:hypothetical protein
MELNEATLRFIDLHRKDDPRALALRAGKAEGVDLPMALTQIAGWQVADRKLPSWSRTAGLLFPRHLSMEQCSSEATARYKASLVEGECLTDLTGGFGVDCFFLAQRFRSAHYVERQEELCDLARHNFPLLGGTPIEVHHTDGTAYLQEMEPCSWIYLDPARRNEQGGKTVAIADCEPDLSLLEPLLLQKAERVLAKLSPMLDIAQALRVLSSVHAVHIVSVRGECKELLLELHRTPTPREEITTHCLNLRPEGDERFCFTAREEESAVCDYAEQPATYLYEPNVSLLKAGAYRLPAQRFGLKKLHPNSHLYTGDSCLEDFPGRRFQIIGQCGFSKKELKQLAALKQANLTLRNFPSTVNELRKRLKLGDGGDTYLFATTLASGEHTLLVCKK